MKFFKIEPEVSVYIGEMTIYDKRKIPWKIKELHLEFEGWLGDDIVTSSPVFCISNNLKEGLEESSFSGIIGFDTIKITKSENFLELYPNKKLPDFFLLRINGVYKKDDFSIHDGDLIISEEVLKLLNKYNISEALIKQL
ncbi:MAG: hypothetical protein AAFQ94_18510 [Bacteroidota bacterium]